MFMHFARLFTSVLTIAAGISALALPRLHPFAQVKHKRQLAGRNDLRADLGYEIYKGVTNISTGLNIWKG